MTTEGSYLGRGIYDDTVRRLPHYISDWTDALNSKVLSSTFFIFFTSIGPAITFSLLLGEQTKQQIGAIEVLLATSITGILFALFAGQPLLIVGVTGPVSILTISIYSLSQQWGINFIPFYAWSQLWGALMIICLAFSNACDSLKYVTRFSCEIFGILIALVYLYTGIEGISLVLGNDRADFSACLLQFIISIGTYYVAQVLSHAKGWSIMNDASRELLSDYGATLSILLWSIVPTLASNRISPEDIPKLFVPLTFETTSGRAWFVDFTDLPVWAVFAAIFPGLIITILFFFDHNVSSLLAQESELKLKKGAAFHLDFLVLGLAMVATALLGLPPTNGLIPQAPLHTKSLTVKKRVHDESNLPTDEFIIDCVYEQRVSNFCQSLLCGIVCFRPFSDALREIPKAVLYGLFLFLGASSFEDNEFGYRMHMIFMDRDLREHMKHPYPSAGVSFTTLVKFTAIQATLCSIIYAVTFTEAGVIFPVLIALLVALRIYVLPKWFSVAQLSLLDSHILREDDMEGVECHEGDIGSLGSVCSADIELDERSDAGADGGVNSSSSNGVQLQPPAHGSWVGLDGKERGDRAAESVLTTTIESGHSSGVSENV